MKKTIINDIENEGKNTNTHKQDNNNECVEENKQDDLGHNLPAKSKKRQFLNFIKDEKNSEKEKLVPKDKFKKLMQRWFIDAFSGMAQGLFVTLIAGTIIKQFGLLILQANTNSANVVGGALVFAGNVATVLMGAGIGAGIARSLKVSNLTIFAAIVAGLIGAYSMEFLSHDFGNFTSKVSKAIPGNPIGSYVCSLIAIEIGNLVSGKTKVDIIVVPMTVIFFAMISTFAAWPIIKLIEYIAKGIELATGITPFVMGVVISATMGILLTMPTSSAAIWISIAMSSSGSQEILLAGGAAVVGCSAHMIGFAVASFRENKFGGLIAQGLGTSMLQIPNIMKNPKILLPPVIASIVVGPLSTTVFKLRCGATGGGMGTSGLVGVISTIQESSSIIPSWKLWLGIVLLMFLLPAVISFLVSELLRKFNWIKFGDMKI